MSECVYGKLVAMMGFLNSCSRSHPCHKTLLSVGAVDFWRTASLVGLSLPNLGCACGAGIAYK